MSQNDALPDELDHRRPLAWDWLLCLLTPLSAIAYHHRRASFSMTHVFCLVLAAFVSSLVSIFLTIAWLREYVADYVATKSGGGLAGFWAAFEELPVEERARILGDYFRSTPKAAVLANVAILSKFFAYSTMALAFYVVYKAKVVTRKALSEPFKSSHFIMSSPKGTGSEFMTYAIAVMNPAASYAINSDRRLAYLGISFLQGFLQSFLFGVIVGLFVSRTIPDVASSEVAGTTLTRLIALTVAAFTAAWLLPVRMAVNNLAAARRNYVNTLIIR